VFIDAQGWNIRLASGFTIAKPHFDELELDLRLVNTWTNGTKVYVAR
jgi:hypothetical protein